MIVFRVDSSNETGTGRVMRCMNLGSARDVFISKNIKGNIISKTVEKGFKVEKLEGWLSEKEDLVATLDIMRKLNAKIIVVDNDDFSSDYFYGLKKSGKEVIVIDDIADRYIAADVIINQNLFATEELYKDRAGNDTKLLLGSEYAMLREEFGECKNKFKVNEELKRVLVTLGGSDNENNTYKIVEMLKDEGYIITVVLGSIYRYAKEMEELASENENVRILKDVANIAKVMVKNDVAICAAGNTVLEMMYLGVPVMVGKTMENQRMTLKYIEKNELGVLLGEFAELTKEELVEKLADFNVIERKIVSEKGKTLIDGRGKYRIREFLDKIETGALNV